MEDLEPLILETTGSFSMSTNQSIKKMANKNGETDISLALRPASILNQQAQAPNSFVLLQKATIEVAN